MRMKRYARMIYMLSQCKDAIDNPAERMARRELSVWRASWKMWTLADISAALTNQELALAVTWLRAEAENQKKQWRTNLLWLYVGTQSCTILLHTFIKTRIHFATKLELPGRSPSHDANSRLLCSEYHERMKHISHANEANFTREWSE